MDKIKTETTPGTPIDSPMPVHKGQMSYIIPKDVDDRPRIEFSYEGDHAQFSCTVDSLQDLRDVLRLMLAELEQM